MNSIEKISEAITEWATLAAKSIFPQISIPQNSGIAKMMMFIGVNPATYNIYDELGFLLAPTIRTYLEPQLRKFFNGMSDEEVMKVAMSYIDACERQASERGHVNLFGVELGANTFTRLREILMSK